MQLPDSFQAPPARRISAADMVFGMIGNFVITVTLVGVRAWAWVTRTPYYKD